MWGLISAVELDSVNFPFWDVISMKGNSFYGGTKRRQMRHKRAGIALLKSRLIVSKHKHRLKTRSICLLCYLSWRIEVLGVRTDRYSPCLSENVYALPFLFQLLLHSHTRFVWDSEKEKPEWFVCLLHVWWRRIWQWLSGILDNRLKIHDTPDSKSSHISSLSHTQSSIVVFDSLSDTILLFDGSGNDSPTKSLLYWMGATESVVIVTRHTLGRSVMMTSLCHSNGLWSLGFDWLFFFELFFNRQESAQHRYMCSWNGENGLTELIQRSEWIFVSTSVKFKISCSTWTQNNEAFLMDSPVTLIRGPCIV